MKPSTKAFIKEAKEAKKYSLFDLIHGYVYMRWPYLYIGIGKGDHPAAKMFHRAFQSVTRLLPKPDQSVKNGQKPNGWAQSYHGKVVPLESARQLVTVQREIRLENLEHIIPFEKARDIILKNPDHIAVIDCPCRKGKSDACLPLDVCLIIGEPFASFVVEHNPDSSRLITSQEAEKILIEEDQRGHAHHAYFKDAVLNRFYAICNCCSCCCGAMAAQRNGTPMIISSGYTCQVDVASCISCGTCQELCPFHAIAMNGKITIDGGLCMGCGVCINQCPTEALSLIRDETKPAPLEINILAPTSLGS